jgi:hypothetical protein
MRDFKFFNGYYNGDLVIFTNGGVERIRITSHGFVGIGTINPSHRLNVHGTSPHNLNFKFFEDGF